MSPALRKRLSVAFWVVWGLTFVPGDTMGPLRAAASVTWFCIWVVVFRDDLRRAKRWIADHTWRDVAERAAFHGPLVAGWVLIVTTTDGWWPFVALGTLWTVAWMVVYGVTSALYHLRREVRP